MATEYIDRVAVGSLGEKGIGLLERAWNWAWALRLVCAVMFLDMAVILRTGHGLWQWSPDDMALLKDVGWLALLIVAFTASVALVLPVVLVLLRQLVGLIPYKVTAFFTATGSDDRPYQRGLGYVPARALRDLALREKNDFLLRLYEDHVPARDMGQASIEQAGNLTAAAVLVSLLDWGLAYGWMPGSVSLVQAIYAALGDWASVVTAVVLLCAVFILKSAWFAPSTPDVIYYPPLDAALRAMERERQAG
ncbi:MAG TPA: hypothetical protein PK461_04760 [Alcaligenes faecalis]|nr:hypothetical protein [Alcaligenes faecalis]